VNFNESYEYLLSLGNEVTAMKLGLDSMTRLLHALGDPQKNYVKVQVAGTNGKGSVCAFLEAICVSAGISLGVTTSPHLVSVTERVRVDGKPISEEEFADLATRVRAAAETLAGSGELETVPTYFEQVTAAALVAFAEAKVKLAILETGLGGRLDATTATNAEIAVITRIDLDHQQYLGDTIEQIAAEKAAIIHQGSLVVTGDQETMAMKVILDRCQDMSIIPIAAGKRSNWQREASGKMSVHGFDVEAPQDLGVVPGLRGRHQIENAYIAVTVASSLANDFGFDISEEQIQSGIQNADHPGRLEFRGRYLFDGAHNIGGARALRQFVDDEMDRPITLVFGAMKDKDVESIAEILFPIAKTLILTRPDNDRAMEPAELETFAKQFSTMTNVVLTRSVAEALPKAEALSTKRAIILVTGSLYLVGEAKQLLNQRSEI
jgi:dihydrofolate synthase/folylpolyglutamate synthase